MKLLMSKENQAKKFNTFKISLKNKILDAKFAICEKFSNDDKAKSIVKR